MIWPLPTKPGKYWASRKMSNILQVNLPLPSADLIQEVRRFVDSLDLDPDKKRWLDEFNSGKINSVLHYFDSPDWLTDLVRREYQHLFPLHRLGGMIGVMKNLGPGVGCLPPHIDRSRALGVNYFLELGGSRVRTVFYDREEPIIGQSYNLTYDEVTPVEEHVSVNGWYCYNVKRCHSVEGIETTRILVAIRLVRDSVDSDKDFEYSIDHFRKDYPDMIA